ncbi:MAG: RNA polymerase sigma factor [Ignavibacteriales bacterium]|nr:RNA polymerase sigma factor [Ignavibacteriales bacterium]
MNNTDYQLIIDAQKGDKQAFEELVFKYDRHVLSIARSYRNSEDDAKDIYQEVFMRVYRGLNSFQFKSEFSTWLFRITTNVCLTHKSRKRDHESIDKEIMSEEENGKTLAEIISGDDDVEKATVNKDLLVHVRSAMDQLPNKQKMVFTLKYLEEYKIREIADIMQCTEGAVKSYLFTATHKMRAKLKNIVLEEL